MYRSGFVLTVFVVAAVAAVLGLSKTALAHAHLERSTPAAGAALPASPPEIRLTFSEDIEPASSRVTLLDAQGNVVQGTVQSSPDGATLVLQVPTLASGQYTVKWEVLSTDTHTTSGDFEFAVAAAPAQTVPLQPAPSGAPTTAPGAPAPTAPSAPAPTASGAPAPTAPSAPAPTASYDTPSTAATASGSSSSFPWVWVAIVAGVLMLFLVAARRR